MALKNNFQTANFSLNIVYEDENIIVVNKPAGINIHPDDFHKNDSLIQRVAQKFPEIKKVGDDSKRPGVVHRLDRDTSGLLIIAKNQESFEYFKKQFKEKKIKKTYIALLCGKLGKMINEKGIIDLPIARSAKNPLLRVAYGKTRGELKKAETEYKIIGYFKLKNSKATNENQQNEIFTLVEAYPKTGRTHQIRAHFKALGHPLIGDKLYAPSNKLDALNRHFLHAFSLEFNLPNGSRIKLETDLPDDLKTILDKITPI